MVEKDFSKWFYVGKGFGQMILWWKRIWEKDFMVEKDFSKWFYVGKGFWKKDLWWKRILEKDFMLEKDLVKWFYDGKRFWKKILWCKKILDQSYLPFIYILVSEEREREAKCVYLSHFNYFSHDVTFLHFWKISQNQKSQEKIKYKVRKIKCDLW